MPRTNYSIKGVHHIYKEISIVSSTTICFTNPVPSGACGSLLCDICTYNDLNGTIISSGNKLNILIGFCAQ